MKTRKSKSKVHAGKTLENLRNKEDFSQQQLSADLPFLRSTIGRIEKKAELSDEVIYEKNLYLIMLN